MSSSSFYQDYSGFFPFVIPNYDPANLPAGGSLLKTMTLAQLTKLFWLGKAVYYSVNINSSVSQGGHTYIDAISGSGTTPLYPGASSSFAAASGARTGVNPTNPSPSLTIPDWPNSIGGGYGYPFYLPGLLHTVTLDGSPFSSITDDGIALSMGSVLYDKSGTYPNNYYTAVALSFATEKYPVYMPAPVMSGSLENIPTEITLGVTFDGVVIDTSGLAPISFAYVPTGGGVTASATGTITLNFNSFLAS